MDRVVKILLISDEDYVKERVKNILSDKNIEINIVDNSKLAKEYLISSDYDIVITDALIWGLTSLEVITILKERKKTSCIIVLSDLATVEIAQTSLKNGAFAFIIKPQDLERIKSYVELYILTKR